MPFRIVIDHRYIAVDPMAICLVAVSLAILTAAVFFRKGSGPARRNRPARNRQICPRWLAVIVAVVILAAYPLSFGPATYAWGRGWLPASLARPMEVLYRPLASLPRDTTAGRLIGGYASWWADAAAWQQGMASVE